MSSIDYFEQPILIVGFHHSGTRLLAKLLYDMGVFQVVDQETFEWLWVQEVNNSICLNWNRPDVVREFTPEKMNHLIFPKETIKKNLLFHNYRRDRLWGVKDPRLCVTLGVWLNAFPKAKIIHLTRDSLDTIGTLAEKYFQFSPNGGIPQDTLPFWGDLLNAYEANIEKVLAFNESESAFHCSWRINCIEVRFEDICKSPHQTLRTLAIFLGIPQGDPVDLSQIKQDRIGIYEQWITEGKLSQLKIDLLAEQTRYFRNKYGYC